jgi:hypothetical protein
LDELGGAELEPELESIGPELELEPIDAIDPKLELEPIDELGDADWTSLEAQS